MQAHSAALATARSRVAAVREMMRMRRRKVVGSIIFGVFVLALLVVVAGVAYDDAQGYWWEAAQLLSMPWVILLWLGFGLALYPPPSAGNTLKRLAWGYHRSIQPLAGNAAAEMTATISVTILTGTTAGLGGWAIALSTHQPNKSVAEWFGLVILVALECGLLVMLVNRLRFMLWLLAPEASSGG